MVVSCLRALEQAAPHTDRSIQLLGLPLMEVHLLRTIGTLDDHHLAPLDDAGPDLSFAASLASATADHLTASLSCAVDHGRSEEHTSELQSLMRISYAVSCLKKTHIQPNH